MIIAVNNRFSNSRQGEDYEQLMDTTFRVLAQRYPQHQFLLIYDRPYTPEKGLPDNAKLLVTGPETSSKLRLQYWLNYKLPHVLKKHGAHLLINTDGCCPVRTGIPQCLLVNDLEFLEKPQGMKRGIARYYQKNMQAFLEKASIIATGSVYIQQKLIEKFELGKKPIELIRPGIDEQFRPFEWDQKEKIKERYADGRSYFLCSASVDTGNLVNLLKAFTLFKKRQKSSMLLLIAGKADPSFKKEFKTYRLREEVKLLEDLSSSELADITGAAYAFVHPVGYANIPLPVIQAMHCAVPVITSNIDPLMTEYAGAALFSDPADPKDMAENMMLLYKDEDLAKKLVGAGALLAGQFDAGTAAEKFMKCINSAFSA